MKNCCTYIPLLLLVCLFGACSHVDRHKAAAAVSDSLDYYPPAPAALSKEEFRHYYTESKHFFETQFVNRGFNGSYLVAKDGQIIVEGYSGFADPVGKKTPFTPDMAFHLASVSKTFTAMAVLKLWEEGRLNLDDSLSHYFTGFPYPGVTVKMLLNHRSGLPNYTHYFEQHKWDKKKLVTNQDVLNSLYNWHPPLQFTTGKHFSYCNTNYALLALLIEKVTGIAYGDYLQKTIFTPLQMNNTYVFSLKDTTSAMPSYEWNNRKFGLEYLDLVYGDKNIYSTTRDMLKWDQALYVGKLFKQATLDSAFAGYSFEKDGRRNYGLGWRMTVLDNGKKMLYHNGWWHGNNTVFIRLLDEHATIIVLGNKFNRKIYTAKKLCDVFGTYQQRKGGPEEENESDTSKKSLNLGSPR